MEQTGEHRIAASRDDVWAGLNDPAVLARCIDGCLSLERTAPDRFDARVKSRIGPVNATFDVELGLEDVVPPERYTLRAQAKGGAAGFARGEAHVELADDGDGTRLRYSVQGNVGGKLAQVGSRLIDGAARKMADDFFSAFQRELGGAPAPEAAAAAAAGSETRAYQTGGNWKIWLAAFIALLLALLFAW
ncbi:MAG: CoxG family protein [bacterium]